MTATISSPSQPLPSGRCIIVTGGASGIGLAVTRLLLSEGAAVAVLDRDAAALTHLRQGADGAKVLAQEVSVADPPAVDRAVDRATKELGPPWGVVTCAGIVRDKTLLKLTDDDWRSVLDVNLSGTFYAMRAAALRMKEPKGLGGRMVAIASIVGLRGGFGQANYAASKAGVVALVQTAAKELGRFGITVNAIAPGFVRTPMTAQYGETLEEACKAESPMGTVCEPEDIARSVRYLLSPEAGHITGVVLRVDGGQAIGA
ncbi:MAG: SDR family oxidoreductase [Euryarchaeota archaeon]|nr:SDR family oxidoreductase [Euryarchaeota archaeon]